MPRVTVQITTPKPTDGGVDGETNRTCERCKQSSHLAAVLGYVNQNLLPLAESLNLHAQVREKRTSRAKPPSPNMAASPGQLPDIALLMPQV